MNAPAYVPDNREQIAAQAQAARIVVSLRGDAAELEKLLRTAEPILAGLRQRDAALRALLPQLSRAARAEIERETEALATQLAACFGSAIGESEVPE